MEKSLFLSVPKLRHISVNIYYFNYIQVIYSIWATVCEYSNSRNDVPRVAQRYRTIAPHTQRHASILVVFVVFGVHMHSFASLIRRTPPPTL